MRKPQHLVLVGAGHAHLETIVHIDELIELGYDVSVVSLGRYLYYSGMGPGLLEGTYSEDDVRFDVKTMVESRGGTFIAGSVTGVDEKKRTIQMGDGNNIQFDVASFAVGSVIGTGGLNTSMGNVLTAKPVENLNIAGRRLEAVAHGEPFDLVVSGGGASGVEIAATAASLARSATSGVTLSLITRGKILRRFPGRVRTRALSYLKNRNVSVIENVEVTGIAENKLELDGSEDLRYDMILLTTGTTPPGLLAGSGIPTGESGGILVNEYLQSTEYPFLFGGGDCIDFAPQPLEKVGVFAVRENQILLHNFKAFLTGAPLRRFEPQSTYHLALNMGAGRGISYRRPLMMSGRTAFSIKDRIDRKFMSHYQSQTTP